jgi:hypothetical protein
MGRKAIPKQYKNHSISISLPVAQIQALKAIAHEEGRPLSKVINQYLTDMLDEKGKFNPESVKCLICDEILHSSVCTPTHYAPARKGQVYLGICERCSCHEIGTN